MTDPVVGSILDGKYVVEGVLGQGGMGVVVAARHRELDLRVAVKCLLAHTRAMPDLVERFTREARAAAKIQGEHVARVIDVGRFDDGTPFMVMEYLQGHDLAAELQRHGPLPTADAVRYVLETCEAVVQAHALRIVHRDLKPSNLFLAEQPGRRPIVKVLDFGISKVIDPNAAGLTKTATIMGTPYYMSPEQLLSSKDVDERADIWALGVILYELVVGQPPFTGDSAPEVVAQVLQNAPIAASLRRPDLPLEFDSVIARCLRSRPEERYANVAELAHALLPLADEGDRDSVLAIARVLGVAAPHGGRGSGHPASIPVAGKPQSHAPPGTAPNLSMSAAGMRPPSSTRRGIVLAAVAASVVVAAAGFVAVRPPAAAPPAEPSGRERRSLAIAPAEPAALVSLSPVEADPPPVPSASDRLAAAAPAAAGSVPAAHRAHASVVPIATAPAHQGAAGPSPVPSAPSPPSPSPSSSAATQAPRGNPLDMHIQ